MHRLIRAATTTAASARSAPGLQTVSWAVTSLRSVTSHGLASGARKETTTGAVSSRIQTHLPAGASSLPVFHPLHFATDRSKMSGGVRLNPSVIAAANLLYGGVYRCAAFSTSAKHGHSHGDQHPHRTDSHSHSKETGTTEESKADALKAVREYFSSMFGHGHSHAHGGHDFEGWETDQDYATRDAASQREEMRITKVGLYWNIALTLSKFVAGIVGNSLSLIADAFHSVSDMLSDAVTMLTIKYASAPADKDHPYGHGRIEDIGTLTVSGIVLLTGLGIGWHALEGISHVLFHTPAAIDATNSAATLAEAASSTTAATAANPHHHEHESVLSFAMMKEALLSHHHEHGIPSDGPTGIALLVALIAVLSKEYLFRVTRKVAQHTQSRIVEINAWHHRSDAASSMVALIGIAGSMMKWPILDPVAALIVGAVITKQGFDMGLNVYHDITDRQMPPELAQSIGRAIRHCSPQGVQSFHGLRGRRMGRSLLVDVSIVVPSYFSVSAAHQAAEAVRAAVMKTRNGITECMVHVDVEGDQSHHSVTKGSGVDDKQAFVHDDEHSHASASYHGHSHLDSDSHSHAANGAAHFKHTSATADKIDNIEECRSKLEPPPLMRPYRELETDVKNVIASEEFKEKSHGLVFSNIVIHYVAARLTITVELSLSSPDPSLSYEALTKVAEFTRQLILTRVKDVTEANVVLRL